MKFFYSLLLSYTMFLFSSVSAITLQLPPTAWNEDIAMTWPTQVQGKEYLVYTYIQLANTYLWDIMILFLFALIVWMGFKVMTNKAGTDEAKNVLKNWLMSAFTGILIILFSYVVVRLLINLF